MGNAVVTPYARGTDFTLVSPTWSTNNAAFGGLSSVADLLGYFDGHRLTSHPAGDVSAGRFIVGPQAGSIVRLFPLGIGADNETADFRLWLWLRINDPSRTAGPVQWMKNLLAVGAYTLCAKTGVSGGIVSNSARYADTVNISVDRALLPDQVRVLSASTPDDSPASLVVDTLGGLLEIETRRNTIATSVNWLAGWLSGS